MAAFQVTKLFGGAICILLSPRFINMSIGRVVPDNQEVFVDPDTDQSLIVGYYTNNCFSFDDSIIF